MENPSNPLYRTLGSVSLVGLLAGLAVLATEEFFAYLSYGYLLPVEPRHLWPYLVTGGSMAWLFMGLNRWRGWNTGKARIFSMAYLGGFSLPLVERLHHLFNMRISADVVPVLLAFPLGLGALIIGWLVFYGLSRRATLSSLLIGCLIGAGLMANRALVTSILSKEALLMDGALLAAALAFAWSMRFPCKTQIGGVVALFLASAFVFQREPINRQQQESETRFASKRKWPNVILVVVDTLRYDMFRLAVEETEEGRDFQSWMDDAVWFDRASAVAPWTVPSMGTVLTGYYPDEHGFRLDINHQKKSFMALPESVPTLAEKFSGLGYQTLAVTTNPLLNTHTGLARGFQKYELLVGVSDKLPLLTAFFRVGLVPKDFYQDARKVRLKLEENLAHLRRSSPLFLWLHLVDPHLPLRKHPHLTPFDYPESFSEMQKLYLDETRWTLEELSKTFDLLEAHDLWEKSLVFFVSDHGEMFPEDQHDLGTYEVDGEERKQLRYGHGHSLHQELIHIPLVVRPPGGLPGGRRVGAVVSHPDIYETIADLLGFRKLKRGRASLVPYLQPVLDPRAKRRYLAPFGHIQKGIDQEGIRSIRYKLIDFPRGDRPVEFYDLWHDPDEHHSLAEKKPHLVENFRGYLNGAKSRMKPPKGGQKSVRIDKATEERLKALGYL